MEILVDVILQEKNMKKGKRGVSQAGAFHSGGGGVITIDPDSYHRSFCWIWIRISLMVTSVQAAHFVIQKIYTVPNICLTQV